MKKCPQCAETYDDTHEVCPTDNTGLILIGSAEDDPMLGRLLDNRYRLVQKIGEGGMGAIYKAVHTEIGRICAIKLMTPITTGKEDAIARFKREAKMASRIDNPHAITIYDFGVADGGMLFLAMEFIDGKTLSRILKDHRTIPIDRAIHITNQIAQGLAAAHVLEIVHRDLKPDNIMLTRKGAETDYVKVLDFGIAKTVAEDAAENLTKTGYVLGTPVYMSPEQLLGEKLNSRSDIYSLGIIVYEMLGGQLPFLGDNPQSVMMKRITSDPIPLRTVMPSINEAVETVVMQALAREPNHRPVSVEAFATQLSAAVHSGAPVLDRKQTSKFAREDAGGRTMEWSVLTTEAGMNPPTGDAPPEGTVSFHSASTAEYTANAFPVGPGGMTTSPPVESPSPNLSGSTIGQFSQAVPPKTQPVSQLATDPNAHIATSNQASVISKPAPRKPLMLWIGIAAALVVVAGVLFLVMSRGGSGFRLTVKSVPPGSVVYVNDARRDTVGADGTLKLTDLPPGPIALRITHDGYGDFTASLTGNKGEERALDALLLPTEIDYIYQGRESQMVLIPAGEFEMGADKHDDDEKPARKVTLPAYYIDKYEVTNALYKKFCDAEKGGKYPETAVGADQVVNNPSLPAVGIPYEDAAAFAKWAGRRLPSEEEWEKAASWDPATNSKRQWPWGDDAGKASANLNRSVEPKLAAAGTFAGDVSAYGVYDMGGNVGEWVDASYSAYKGNPTPNPKKNTEFDSKFKVVRGGSIKSTIDQARTTFRGAVAIEVSEADRKFMLIGIRCAISANDPRIQEFLHARK